MELCDTVDAIIDAANSMQALYSIFETLTLPIMKQLKEVNNPETDPSCSSVYDEINHLSKSIKPITVKLPMDVMIHITQFIVGSDGYKGMELKLLPTLSKDFRSIMSNPCIYSKHLELYIADDDDYTDRGAYISTHVDYIRDIPYFRIASRGCPVSASSLPWKDLQIVNIDCSTKTTKYSEFHHISELFATLTNVKN